MQPIDPATMYRTDLAASVKIGRRWYYPGRRLVLRGDVLQGIIDADASRVNFYEPVVWVMGQAEV